MEHRNLDKPMMTFSILDEISKIKAGPQWAASGKTSITLSKNEHMRVVLVALARGKSLEEHQTDEQISVAVVQGAIRFHALGEQADLAAGGLLTLHPSVGHAVEALEDSFFVITIAL